MDKCQCCFKGTCGMLRMSLDMNGERMKELLMYCTVGNRDEKCEGLRELGREGIT